ncbi:MAG: glycosyltransferase [Pseudonocardiales bacterium]|nr:glycosyltransferase [Pseudonocardiales bacterium]MBV9651215.1 glycosyltransferase [Pseudonocardiales bacterium]
MSSGVTVVIATRNRRDELIRTLQRLHDLVPAPPVIVVDNGSTDGTAQAVGDQFAATVVLALPRNHGAAARNLGVVAARTPYVAFSDDDSWWAPGALERAAVVLDSHPRLGLVAARTLVGPMHRADPITLLLECSPLPRSPDAPGPSVLGFLACSAVMRKAAFCEVGGFSSLLFFVGEERLLCYDLATAGWERSYLHDIVAYHHPSSNRSDPQRRRVAELRNALLTAVLRRPRPVAVAAATSLARDSMRDGVARTALGEAIVRLPAALRRRAPLPPAVEEQVRMLEDAG